MTPHIENKQTKYDVDESTDTYDTVEWLLENIPKHNGRVGLWGVSYSGYCAAAGMIDAHPAIKAASPQGPNTDYWHDHFRSNGAFLLLPALEFVTNYGEPALGQGARWHMLYIGAPTDGYRFLLDLGPVSNLDRYYLKGQRPFWDALVDHPTYDEFWRSRALSPHLTNVAPAVMTVGGWFDSENLHGSLDCYRAIEEQNPEITNVLVMGPWEHDGWMGGYESQGGLGDVSFGSDTAEYFRDQIELPFFNKYLKNKGSAPIPEAHVFVTGRNQWRSFNDWPPKGQRHSLYLRADGALAHDPAPDGSGDDPGWDEFVSDPLNPVPYTQRSTIHVLPPFMVEDQRFVGARVDVLMYESEPLEHDVTIAGPMEADLWVSTSETDADWVVKLIDGFPKKASGTLVKMIGYQMLVRGGVLRGRFRNDPSQPERFVPTEPTRVKFTLQDVCHTFKAGHRIVIQVQSSWFPYVDRNPQKYVDNIVDAQEWQFVPATHRVFRSRERPSRLEVNVIGTD
jgi:putative CocE/NonD family hydrolase